ncbi:MAG: phenylalanine--tRNA ligase beta subunit-related protein [Armatimonadota bacterium]|nr:phenylalanine--tRNA ligase beta subunit-related protein [Armatimonadota bacterium]MDR7450180.1 phenylalanine--tRNA ligase beta subunit-related protein [Armatimonadota bacterium]MDR7459215.1 phenylalanine--tRNA ligase beta subunit-related protein [Armatimonadota bacterium]MDR7479683.1 phenylalanine--tRNA ligase beta subunit-related protein [Armatimonadota bacterium]MDR7487820.1 phenylalanine--tRNA ligase beta subunit-related protein [Armatimonadota bacterium]
MREVTIAPEVVPLVRVGLVEVDGVQVGPRSPELAAEIAVLVSALRRRYAGREPAQIEALAPARELYHRIGIDPTKLRPSSEALLRRVLRGQDLPEINAVVDTSNLCSLDFLLPIGLHDLEAAVGPLVLRRGRPGEGYEAIGKGWYSVEGRLTLADGAGPCGTPTSDSRRTMVTGRTRRVLMVIYAPSAFPLRQLEDHVARAAERMRRFAGGEPVGVAVLPAAADRHADA